MGLEELKQEILEKTAKEKDSIISKATTEAKQKIKEVDVALSEYRKKVEADTEKMIEAMEKREIASAELDLKKLAMGAKKEVIDAAFKKAEEKLLTMPKAEKEKIMQSLLAGAKSEMEIGRIFCREEDTKYFSKYETVTSDFSGGIIVENKDGTIRLDLSYPVILESIRERSLQDIGRVLFEK